MSAPNQYEAYSGTMPDEPFLPGTQIQVKLTPAHTRTRNQSLWDLWDIINGEAQSFSNQNETESDIMSEDVARHALKSIDNIFAETATKIRTRVSGMFSATYGGSPDYSYENYPIRWANKQRFALMVVKELISSAYQLIHVPSNRVDRGIMQDDALTILRPLYFLKAEIMRTYFGQEIRGEVSADEIDAVFRTARLSPPLRHSLDDDNDLTTQRAAEDQEALTDESTEVPDEATLSQMIAGKDVWTWKPEKAHWTAFGAILARRKRPNGASSAPEQPIGFSTDTLSSDGEGPESGGAPRLTNS